MRSVPTRAAAGASAAMLLWGCAERELPPLGETVVVVDLDLPVPKVVSRLRVDVYDEEGAWLESRELSRPDAAGFPLSFSVHRNAEEGRGEVWLRLRAFPSGSVRDYLGERFGDWSFGSLATPAPPVTPLPRLVVDGVDRTPPDEPLPLVTVDRLLRVPIEAGEVQQVEVVLHAACAGTMAYFGEAPERGPQRGEAQSCVDLEKQRVLVEPSPTGPRGPDPALSRSDTFDLPCAAPPAPGRACIPGGATILGSSAVFLVPDLPPVPERLTVVPPFYIDLDEVTVGRYRQALADGFVAPTIVGTHQGPLGDTIATTCTFSTSDLGREGYALNCVDWITAEAFCAFAGGRLPSEAEWEHAATLAGGDRRSIYPYGDEAPTCERAVHGRFPLANSPGVCEHLGRHPEPIDAAPDDVTAQGLRGMAGGLSEWQRDAYAPYDDACWAASPIAAPSCDVASPARRSVRGGNWVAPSTLLPSASRTGADPAGHASFIGFRCVYPAEASP